MDPRIIQVDLSSGPTRIQEYEVVLCDADPISDGAMELQRIRTYGSWQVEGRFLITWNSDGMRQADRLPANCTQIRTELVKKEELPTVRGVDPSYAESAE